MEQQHDRSLVRQKKKKKKKISRDEKKLYDFNR